MRTTTRIDDDVLERLKDLARKEEEPLTRVLNGMLRAGLQVARKTARQRRLHHEKTHAMGRPRMNLRKALAGAAGLENEETLPKLTLRR